MKGCCGIGYVAAVQPAQGRDMDPATAKAVQATAKAADKALTVVHDTGGYLREVVGDLPKNAVGLLGADWLGQKRMRNLDAMMRRTDAILRERDAKAVDQLSPNIATELLTGAQDESRDELIELWARLLANALDPKLNSVRHSFVAAVKAMDPLDAVVLRFVHEGRFTRVDRGGGSSDRTASTEKIAAAVGRRMDEVAVSMTHLEVLGLFEMLRETDRNTWHVNETNREFMLACYPERSEGTR